MATKKTKRKSVKKHVSIVGAPSGSHTENRKVFRGPIERANVSPVTSHAATVRIERLEAASARTGQRLGDTRLD